MAVVSIMALGLSLPSRVMWSECKIKLHVHSTSAPIPNDPKVLVYLRCNERRRFYANGLHESDSRRETTVLTLPIDIGPQIGNPEELWRSFFLKKYHFFNQSLNQSIFNQSNSIFKSNFCCWIWVLSDYLWGKNRIRKLNEKFNLV